MPLHLTRAHTNQTHTHTHTHTHPLPPSADEVAEGLLQLITDTDKSGAVMTVTLAEGIKYQRLFGDQN